MPDRESQLARLVKALMESGWSEDEASEDVAPLRTGRGSASEIALVVRLVDECTSRFKWTIRGLESKLRAGRRQAARANRKIKKLGILLEKLERTCAEEEFSVEDFGFECEMASATTGDAEEDAASAMSEEVDGVSCRDHNGALGTPV
jgi:hypothetical protein